MPEKDERKILIGPQGASSESMTNLTALSAEHATLSALVATHRGRVMDAADAVTDAMEAAGIPTRFGVYQLDVSKDGWRYPSVAEAVRVRDMLRDDDGYYWAESRVRDLEMVLGLGYHPQALLPFDGLIPSAHASVDNFRQAALRPRCMRTTMIPANFADECIDTAALCKLLREGVTILNDEVEPGEREIYKTPDNPEANWAWRLGSFYGLADVVCEIVNNHPKLFKVVFGDGPWGHTTVTVMVLSKTEQEALTYAESWYSVMYQVPEGTSDGHAARVTQLDIPTLKAPHVS